MNRGHNSVNFFYRLKLFLKGDSDPQRYRGPRDLASLAAFIKENLGVEKVIFTFLSNVFLTDLFG